MKTKNPILGYVADKCSYADFLLTTAMKNYRDIFKAGVFLFGLAIAGISQPYVDLIKMDYETRKLEFSIQAQENKFFKDVNCETLKQQKSECLQAQYQHKSNFSIFKIGAVLIASFGVAGYTLVGISIIGFLVSAKEEYKKKKNTKPSWRKREHHAG